MSRSASPAKPTGVSSKAMTESPPRAKVHPLAQKLAGLLSDMSLEDQCYASKIQDRVIFGALLVSYPIAYATGHVFISIAAVLAAGTVCLFLFLPNWRQRKDPGLKWADDAAVYQFHKQLEAARSAAKSVEGSNKSDTQDQEKEKED